MEPRPRGRPRSEPLEVQRERILEAARHEFTTYRYDSVKVSRIASAAKVTRPTVYEIVGDKETLLMAVAEQLADELVDSLEQRFAEPDQVERPLTDLVHADLDWFINYVRERPALVTILRLANAVATPDRDPAASARRRIEDRITRLHVERSRRWGGAERGESARVMASLIVAIAESVAFRSHLEPNWPSSGLADIAIEFATGGYVRIETVGRPATDEFDRMVGEAEASDAEQRLDAQGESLG